MIGKWHVGEGNDHEPTGFDYWSIVPGQGKYWDPQFIEPSGTFRTPGYATDIITDKSIDWMEKPDKSRPFFLMCHHKAPHRSWEYHHKHKDLYKAPEDVTKLRPVCKETAEVFTSKTSQELAEWKFQRYMQRYMRTIQSIDDNVGRMLDWLEEEGLKENTIVVYTSDRGFFLGEHGWFDKRFMYEETFQMPFMIRYPQEIKPQSVCSDIICNVDFAPTFLDFANARIPSYMQGVSFRPLLDGNTPKDWQQVAYHRYWMHRDIIHEAYAHYGVRDQRYKLIYWYNEGFEIEGTRDGGQEKEWELFDCQEDPLELFNCYNEPKYVDVVRKRCWRRRWLRLEMSRFIKTCDCGASME
jgi:arylsulfatase A-like enzyme